MKRFIEKFSSQSILLSVVVLMGTSCTSEGKKSQASDEDQIIESVKVDEKLMEDFNKSKLIFYSLPSPLETAMLIKRAGANYDEELLNPLSNIKKYSTNKKMALNLGIYSADLSYTSLFDQTQSSIKYMANARKLADALGILDAIDENTIKRLEENMNNREVVMEVISETFMNSNSYLTENNRPEIAIMVLVGGWIEGLHIATQLTTGSIENNKRLLDRIVYQKLSLYTVINLLDAHSSNEDIQSLIVDINELKNIFDKIKIINKSKVEALTDEESKVTTIKADSETFISEEVFKALLEKVKEIRTGYVS